MSEEELKEAIEILKNGLDNPKVKSENCFYFDEYQMNTIKNMTYNLEKELAQEKENNKNLEKEYVKAIESEADIAVGSHKLINNLAQAIRFMGTNEKLTVEDIIKEFSKENKVTEDFMERWEKSQYEESHLKDKVIDMMVKDMPSDVVAKICEKQMDLEMDCYADVDGKSCSECIKEYYFKVAKGEEYKNKYCGGED